MEIDIAVWNNFGDPPPTFLGALLLAMAIYFSSMYYFYPQKFAPKLTQRMANWMSGGIMATCGLIEIVFATIERIHSR